MNFFKSLFSNLLVFVLFVDAEGEAVVGESKLLNYMMSREIVRLQEPLNNQEEMLSEYTYSLFIYWYYINKGRHNENRDFSRRLSFKLKSYEEINVDFLKKVLNDLRTHDSQFSSKVELDVWYEILLIPIEKEDFLNASKYENLVNGFVAWFEELNTNGVK